MDRDTTRLFERFDETPRNSRASSQACEVVIRPARVSDAPRIGRISADREGTDPERAIAAVERHLIDDSLGRSRLVLVAEVDGSVVGYGKARHLDGKAASSDSSLPEGWYLTGVVVDPCFRRMGVGAALTAARVRWIAERDSEVYYFANARNRVGIALHDGFGFAEIARGPTFGGESFVGGEGVLFRADLGAPDGEQSN